MYTTIVFADELIKPNIISVSFDTPQRHGVRRFEVNMKKCTKCHREKSLSDFHRSIRYKDGHVSRCKICIKAIQKDYYSTPENRAKKASSDRDYRNNPDNTEKLKAKRREYFLKPENKARHNRTTLAYYHKTKDKTKVRARDAVSKALKNGHLTKQPCYVCDNPNSQAHHEDYSEPLVVFWLCHKHHVERHVELRSIK